jgi:ligand-binding sensor domain-containing protein
MNIHFLHTNHLILSLFFVVTACNSQVKTDPPKGSKYQQPLFIKYHPQIVRTQGATYGNLHCELEDLDGNLWFSSDGEGVYRFDGRSFTNFTTKDGLCDNTASTIIQTKSGDILLGTNAGICKYDGKKFSKYFETDTLNNLRIIALLEDRDGNIWFSAMNKGVYRYDGTNLSNFLHKYKHPIFAEKQEKMISDIKQDKKGNIWFSSFNRGGAWRYDGKILTHFLPSSDYYTLFEDERSNAYSTSETKYVHSPDYITDDMIHSMTEDKSGNIWFATRRHGICIYDGKTFINFKGNEVLGKISPTTILEDKKGIIWLGTEESGVFSYDTRLNNKVGQGKTFKNYTTTDGLVNNSVRSILEDKDGNLWFGTRSFGLSRFDGKTFTTFSEYKAE